MQNFVQPGDFINAAATSPATVASGDPVLVGQIPGVAVTAEGAGDNKSTECTIMTRGVFKLPVKAVDGSGSSAVQVGDQITYTAADDPPLSKKAVGTGTIHFGYALGALTSGSTGSIPVLVK